MSYYRVESKRMDSDEWDPIPPLYYGNDIALLNTPDYPKLSKEEATKQRDRLLNSFPYELRVSEVND